MPELGTPERTMPLDAETKVAERPGDHETELRLWLRLLTCTTLIEGEIRRRLRESFDVTLPRFDLMAQLDRAPQGLRMSELSSRLMVTGGNVTGLTDTLEDEGLVVRESDGADRRALRVKLTREGRRVFRAMAAEHERWVAELFEGLSAREARSLSERLHTLKQHILDNVPLDERATE